MDEMNQLKVFTPEEANRLIPQLKEMITELRTRQKEILAKEVEIDALELLYPEEEEEKPSPQVAEEIENYNKWVNEFYSMIDQIHELGCFLKDIETGLVDFYSLHQGRVVYLCWKLGEEEVGYWHEVGRGYAYRQPIIREDERESSG
ncbi:MAG: DUF2203 domain-containing protein [Candidatus Omnitrophica bacterium]|nr:DUF2203 domain-containing protein [Candidatus Omnitrophota bacterium]